jgi:hypothetical protein
MKCLQMRERVAGVLSLIGFFISSPIAQTSADQNFQTRCTATGVVKCLSFDNATGITLSGAAKIDNTLKASGAGSMRVDIAPTAGDTPGNIMTKLGADFAEGSSLYLQWRQRFSPEMVDVDLGGEGFKQFVIYDGTPCGPNMEVAMLNQDYSGFPILYTACGNSYLRKTLTGDNYALMWNADGTICTSQNKAGCLRYKPDQWMTFYYEQKIGTWGQPNSVVKVSMAEEGKPLKTFIDFSDYIFKSDKATSAYRDIWIGPFSLGRKANASYPTARTWFDEFIISKTPIADPFQGATKVHNPALQASGKSDGLHVRIAVAHSRITLSFPAAKVNTDIRIYDRLGRMVKGFNGVSTQTVDWDATGFGKGVYLVEVLTGNHRYAQKVSLLK